MAQLSFMVPDALLARIVSGLCQRNGYQETITDGEGNPVPNPVTKGQFAKRIVADWLIEQTVVAETEAEQEQASRGDA